MTRAGKSSSSLGGGSGKGCEVAAGAALTFLVTGGNAISKYPLVISLWVPARTVVTVATGAGEGLFLLCSGTFSFCATVVAFVLAEAANLDDVVGRRVFFCCGCCCCCCVFFFLLGLEAVGTGVMSEEPGGACVLPPTLPLMPVLTPPPPTPFPLLTVSSEEMSNMVGTARNSRCVSPPSSSSDEERRGAAAGCAFSPPRIFLREDFAMDEEEERG